MEPWRGSSKEGGREGGRGRGRERGRERKERGRERERGERREGGGSYILLSLMCFYVYNYVQREEAAVFSVDKRARRRAGRIIPEIQG